HAEGRIVYANSAAARMVGVASPQELLGVDVITFVTPEGRPIALERIRREYLGEVLPLSETRFLRADGSTVDVETVGARVDWGGKPAIQVLVRNITDRKRAQESMLTMERRLLHIQRLESLGVMAGGIAHDFNNILQAILGNAEVASAKLKADAPAINNLQELTRAAGRARDLTRQIFAYTGKGRLQVQALDLNDILRELQEMIRISISRRAEIHYELPSLLPPVEADPAQVRQAVMNLVINASEALGEERGTIRLQTGFTDCDEAYLHSFWEGEPLPAGRYVYLEVADTGCGMDAATRSRIFDPFFTTKFTGRGLGLAAVMGIVRGHKGAIKVSSEPGKGSTFRLLFPAGRASAQTIARRETSCQEWQGKATILLVDDEEGVRDVGRQMIEHLGFCVMTAGGGVEALATVSEHRDDIACVILDLTMPSMDGEEVFQEMRKLAPEMKIVLSSGFNQQTVTQQWAGKDLAGFIQKPYNLSTLESTLKEVLGA
ncbi:MAG TPA: response regulator, partial [Spirochaetia bacterium]|nr:response regulator [Spirochaetia bacterium]